MAVVNLRGGEGCAQLPVALVTGEPNRGQFPLHIVALCFSPRSKDYCHLLSAGVGCLLFQTCKIPSPLNHWCLCAGSSGWRTGNHKACRPVGCSPTEVLCVCIPHTHILLAVSVPAWLLHMCNSTARKSCSTSPLSLGFPGGSDGKESTCSAGDLGSIPGSGRSPGGRHGNPLQYSCLESPSWTEEPGVTKSQTQLSSTQL